MLDYIACNFGRKLFSNSQNVRYGWNLQDTRAFWNWTFTEMARYDVPAAIDGALAVAGKVG